MRQNLLIAMSGVMLFAGYSASAVAQSTELFVDKKTQQIFAEPGPGRVKLGTAVITPGTQPPLRKSS